MLLSSPSVLQTKFHILQESDRSWVKCSLPPITLGLTTGFNTHSFAQKIKPAHPETPGHMQGSQSHAAHHVAQEEETKRGNGSGLQGGRPAR